jgi:hypothetical protein
MDRSEKIKQLQQTVRELERKIRELLQEDHDPCHPKYSPPLCCNRIKDYYEWMKECEDYEKNTTKDIKN